MATRAVSLPAVRERAAWRKVSRYLAENWMLFLIGLPGVLFFLVFHYVPMFGVVVAFEDFSPKTMFFSRWVGLQNFRLLWGAPKLALIVRNTIVLNVLFVAATTLSSVTIALLLNEVRSRWFRSAAQLLMFLPFFMGWTLVSMVLYGLLDYNVGTLNRFLVSLGWRKLNLDANPGLWPWILALIRVWKQTGSGCIIYLAVLVGIDPQLYESAAMDGASRWQRMRHISLPAMVPTMVILTLLAVGRIFYGDYGMLYALVGQRPMLYQTTDVIDTYILRGLRANLNFGIMSAVGLSQSLLGFICVLGSNLLVRWWSHRQGEEYELF
ncbi:MAG: ABC transporter permease subunit [Anaerolineae bacterium]|nr:ABC transporter permease subunit [Anaerolineae bacterium]